MEIKNEHIREAEKILIGGNRFDTKERIPFIKDLESCDLLAVPGSGKTTALLAKLYCISQNLPLENGSGILVLSHTNAAIDEIENKLKKHCPNLFSYPNFVGTVQSFVNKFLAIPCYSQHYGGGLRIDEILYNKEITSYLATTQRGPVAYYKHKNIGLFYNARYWYNEDQIRIISDGISTNKLTLKPPQSWVSRNIAEYNIDKTLSFINKMKTDILKKGILHYDDCYFFANAYCKKHKQIKDILQNRFKYIFIDEMQDLEYYQIEQIDKLFYSPSSTCILQRIGDVNQSIYNSGKKVKINADWQPRNLRFLTGSNRLTPEIASLANYFTLDKQEDHLGNPRFVLEGLRVLENPIKPHLILFDNDSKGLLKSKFIDLIKDYELENTPEGNKYGFKIIGWNAQWDDDEDHSEKMRLEDIFPTYHKDQKSKHKETYNSLSEYINSIDSSKRELRDVRKTILNIFITILRLEGKKVEVCIRGRNLERYYQASEMINEIRMNTESYAEWNIKLYQWSVDLLSKKAYEVVYSDISNFATNQFKKWFDLDVVEATSTFLGECYNELLNTAEEEVNEEDISIEIETVHSAKGQTHCATMYVETSYYKYESKKKYVLKALQKTEHLFNLRNNKDILPKQAFKMLYVGLSRPTHLLCYAILKENIRDDLKPYFDAGWEVIDITS